MNIAPTARSTVSVGIITAPVIIVCLRGRWLCDGRPAPAGKDIETGRPCAFTPLDENATFTLRRVMIGKQFHWQRRQDQEFRGELKIIREGDALTAVNIIGIEEYLKSVVSSEMSANAPLEFLKASAVISRSWLIRQIMGKEEKTPPHFINTPHTIIRWADHHSHTLYDVCADDHCQRYQGISRITNPNAVRAVEETAGQVLIYGGGVCDCRFSKCCGGKTEEFATCWQDVDVPYLRSVADTDPKDGSVLCDTHDPQILDMILNSYDRPTTDFYRWQLSYSQSGLAALVEQTLHCNLGKILELIPVKRGPSGRISLLEIRGSNRTLRIGKELLIRKALSRTHLPSSAFDVEPVGASSDCAPERFIITGKGWGHGVGMCQIGAAVMGVRGYDYREILQHYYPDTTISALNYSA